MIADTTFLIDLLRGKKEAVELLSKINKELKTTIINQYETFVGINSIVGIDTEKKVRDTKIFFQNFDILPLDEDAMFRSARLCGMLIQKGRTIDDNDCMIAGIALRNGIDKIITRNKSHFERISEIKVISY